MTLRFSVRCHLCSNHKLLSSIDLQRKLRSMGYSQDEIDGRMGKATKAAVIQFQKDRKLPIGQLDFATLKLLNLGK